MRDPDIEPYVVRMRLALVDRHFDRCRRIIDDCERSLRVDPITADTLLTEIDVLPVRVVHALERADVRTVRDVLQRTPADLAELPSIGPGAVREIITTLKALPIHAADGDE